VGRFDGNDKNRPRLVRLSKTVLGLILFIQLLHLSVIVGLLVFDFDEMSYAITLVLTAVVLVFIAIAVQEIIVLTNRPNKQKEQLTNSFSEVGIDFDEIREKKRRSQLLGE